MPYEDVLAVPVLAAVVLDNRAATALPPESANAVTGASAVVAPSRPPVVVHILFEGGDPITEHVFRSCRSSGHHGFVADSLEDALLQVSSWYKDDPQERRIAELEVIAHGTSWRQDATTGSINLDPPSLQVGAQRLGIAELQTVGIAASMQQPYAWAARCILNSCNMGQESKEYVAYREALALRFFGIATDPSTPASVEFRSCDSYLNNARWPVPAGTSPESMAPPQFLQSNAHVRVEKYYRNYGRLIWSQQEQVLWPGIHPPGGA